MARQTVQPDQWIVVDDGLEHATLTMGQTHIKRKRVEEGPRSLAMNLLAGLPLVRGDALLIFEDDDWYSPDHIQVCMSRLHAGIKATGSNWQRYHNVSNRHWIIMRNKGSALCNTAILADLIPQLTQAARDAYQTNRKGIDQLFWTRLPQTVTDCHDIDTVVGIKGLPGRKGIGMGHQPPDRRWTADPRLDKLREWIGADAELYAGFG